MKVFFYNDTYNQQLIDFIKTVWDKNMTVERLVKRRLRDFAENPYAEEGGFPIAIATNGNKKIIGHHAGTPYKLWANGKEHLSYWLAGLHVLPEGRRQSLAKALQQTTNQLPITTSFWVIEATLKVKRKLGWTIVGKIPEYVKVLDTKNFISAIDFSRLNQVPNCLKPVCKFLFSFPWNPGIVLLKIFIKVHQGVLTLLFPHKKSEIVVKQVKDFDNRINELWDRNKNRIRFAQVRKADYLNWQFKSDMDWIKIIADDGLKISGYAIVSLKKIEKAINLTGIIVLSIIDIFWDFNQPEILNKLICFIEEMARQKGAKILISSINDKAAKRILLKNGFIRIPGTVYFGFHNTVPDLTLSPKLDDWFITRGDADAAGSLAPNG